MLLAAALGCLVSGVALASCDNVPADHEHVYGVWQTDTAATCSENGLRHRDCLVCGYSEEADIPALGHDWDGGVETKAPSCSEEGERTESCRRCEETRTTAIPASPHDWDVPDVKLAASCINEGEALLTCLVCHTTQEVTLPKTDHLYKVESETPATCTENGKRVLKCTLCDKETEETLQKKGHRWKAGETDREPTCTEAGERNRTCLVCDTTEKETLDALGHSFAGEYTVDEYPTFDHEGSKSYHCTRCGAKNGETVIPKLQVGVPIDYEFRILRNNGEYFSDPAIVVTVYDGEEKVAESNRSTLQNGVFTVSLEPKTYTARVTKLPDGYSAEESYTVEAGDPRCDLRVTASPIAAVPDKTTRYSLGSVMYDFTLSASMTTDGNAYTLSDLLKTKKIVVLNFWATWCEPCKSEFPMINRVYQELKEEIALLAIDQSTSDSLQGVKQFAATYGLSFPMAFDLANRLQSMFGVSSIPTTVVIDGEGVVCEIHTGVFTSEEDLRSMLAPYLADNYWKAGERAPKAVRAKGVECILPDKRGLSD